MALTADDRARLTELIPALRRAVRLDDLALARLRLGPTTATVLVRLPFGTLVSRTVRTSQGPGTVEGSIDVTVRAADVLAWFDDPAATSPVARDAEWRTARPPDTGWQRIDSVPEDVVRGLVRQGALALEGAAVREGVPGAQPRATVADALLDATVLTLRRDDGPTTEVSLRALSALVRMGFLPRGGEVRIDVANRWTRIVAGYGTVYLERAGQQLTLR